MKKLKIALLFVAGCFFASSLFAQEHKIVPTGPMHPLVNFGMTREDVSIDTQYINVSIINSFYDLNNFDSELFGGELTALPGVFNTFRRSEDKLTDTLYCYYYSNYYPYSNETYRRVYRYNEKGQLLYAHTYRPPEMIEKLFAENGYSALYESYTFYEYDEEGRQTKVENKNIRKKTATETAAITAQFPLEVFVVEEQADYSNLQMTETGYIYGGAEYELDNQGRLTYLKYLSDVSWAGGEDGYFEYIDGKKISGKRLLLHLHRQFIHGLFLPS